MSVDCRIVVGLTLEFACNLTHEDFEKCHAFTDKHPELDEYEYRFDEKEGKLLLIADGMNGDFLRLVKVDRIIEELEDFDFVSLPMNNNPNPDLINQMSDLYEEYTGTKPNPADFKYAMWTQWS